MSTRLAVGVWTLALLAGSGAFWLVLASDHKDDYTWRSILAIAVGLCFVAGGLVISLRRPDNRTGAVMVATGFAWFVGALTQANDSVVFTLGVAVNDLPWAFFALLILSYPAGRLEGVGCKAIVAGAFALALVVRPLWTLFADLRVDHPNAPSNAFLVDLRPGVAEALERTEQVVALVLIAGAIAILVQRWRAASPPLRRALSPVLATFGASIVVLFVSIALDAFDVAASEVFYWMSLAALLTVPLSFALGFLRTRLARAGIGQLLVDLGDAPRAGKLEEALGRALNDPSLEIAYRLDEDVWVDVEGKAVQFPDEVSGRVATLVEREGRCIAALVHDESLGNDPALVEAVAAAAGLALENEQRLAALAESESRQRALLDALPDLMFRMSAEGRYLEARGNERDLVAPRDELIGASVHDVLPPDVADELMRCAQRVLETDGVQSVEYQLRLGSTDRHFEARIVASGADELLIIVRDISDRKRAEAQLARLQAELQARLEELQRERDFIETVVQAAPSFFCLVDPGGRIVRFNRTLEEASGYADDESTRGRPFWDVFVVPEDVEEVRQDFLERPGGENENEWARADGDRLTVAWSVTPLVDEGGEPHFLITGMDVTERKRHEDELRSSRARIVEAGDVERRRLERNLHDGAQQRLVSISLFLRLAEGKVGTDPDGAAQMLATAAEELAQALEELRELARGIHPAVLTDRGLEPALKTLVSRSPVPATLAEAPAERLPEPVEAAAYYVVSEALANVAKYAQASAATVRVARNDGRAVVEVADDGVGGANPSLGSGLRGLADRVEALDGRLHVESAPGAGTTVRAEIPVDH